MKILVPVDGSEYSMKAVRTASDYAKQTKADVIVVTVTPFFPGIDLEISANSRENLNEGIKRRGEEVLEKAKGMLAAEGVSAATVLSSAISAADEIISIAEKEKADLIIIGNRGMGGAATRFFMGSVASKVINHAPCSVYVIKTA
jgi:nucleotide-binding universal stress UspA family protein